MAYYNPYNNMPQHNNMPQQYGYGYGYGNVISNAVNSGLISISSEQEARNYPVAYGNSVIFKDEREPYIYVKTMGSSQLDSPTFDKYRLVRETSQNVEIEPKIENQYKSMYEELKAEIEAIKDKIKAYESEVAHE